MTIEELTLIENQIFTQLLLEEFRKQRKAGVTEFLIDKYEIDKQVKEQLKKIISER